MRYTITAMLVIVLRSFGSESINLPVPFKAQEPPGTFYVGKDGKTHWASLNCGPTTVLMVRAYYTGSTPSSSDITKVDNWLDSRYPALYKDNHDGNGGITYSSWLQDIAQHYADPANPNDVTFPNSIYSIKQWGINDLLNELRNGHPVIVGVQIKMSVAKDPLLGHFMVLRGIWYDGTDATLGQVIVNDPGVHDGSGPDGNGVQYSVQRFLTSWGLNSNAVVVVRPPLLIRATLDGQPWPASGTASLHYNIYGPQNYILVGAGVPDFKQSVPTGTYTATYFSGGPPNSTLIGVSPCIGPLITSCAAPLADGQSLAFTFLFVSNPPTAGFTMSSGNQSANENQTLNVAVPVGGSASVTFDGTTRSKAFNSTITGWQWTIGNSNASASTGSFTTTLAKGTYPVTLVVTDSLGGKSTTAQGTVNITDNPPVVSNGWRMGGRNGQRTNQADSSGPATLPQFHPLITSMPSTLNLIDPDGSLIFFDGSRLYSYTNSGALRWQQTIPVYWNPYPGTEIIIGPSGVIYSITPNNVWAWNKDTGAMVWANPVTIPNSGDERGGSITDRAGNLYINTGANYVGVPQELTSISPAGAVRWQTGFYGRGYFSPVLSADETLVYIYEFGCDYACGFGYTHALDTTNGQPLYRAGYLSLGVFAPWNILFALEFDGSNSPPTVACTQTLSACPTVPGSGVLAIAGSNVALAGANGSVIGLSPQGVQLWSKTEPFSTVIGDAAGTVFALAPNTGDVVAFSALTGVDLWRQHFTSPPSQIVLGDDGCLYVSSNPALYKACH